MADPEIVIVEVGFPGEIVEIGVETETVHVDEADPVAMIEAGMPGPPGRDGADGAMGVSSDPNNRLVLGSDGGLYFRDDLAADPLAHYLNAKE